ncbi:MAG: hypothetical protein K2K14_09720 [Ruminococcus sp.]|nr:hypothetical protein [Ruminococcus sp.]
MNKNKKDFMNQLSDLDDLSVEEIAENYPALDEKTKKRIVRKSMKKYRFLADRNNYSEELTVSGTERYNHVTWYKYASSVAALLVAVVGIASVVMIRGNLNGDDDFEIDTPPAVSSDEPETDSMSEAATATTSKKGYVAGGYDYANDNEYSGIIVGEPSQTTPAVDESSSENTAEEPSVNNNSNNTPATQAPVTPPVTQPPTTSPVTDVTQSESQKSYLNDLYYVEIEGVSGCLGFNFMLDGTLNTFAFNDYGNKNDDTSVLCSYEIIGNQFSYGLVGYELNWKTGTIVNPNDSGNFNVQFEDGLYHFNVGGPIFMKFKEEIVLAGVTYYGYGVYDERVFTFYEDGISGSYITTKYGTGMSFTYSINGDEITFHMGEDDNIIKAKIITDNLQSAFAFQWPDGNIEYFYYDSFYK